MLDQKSRETRGSLKENSSDLSLKHQSEGQKSSPPLQQGVQKERDKGEKDYTGLFLIKKSNSSVFYCQWSAVADWLPTLVCQPKVNRGLSRPCRRAQLISLYHPLTPRSASQISDCILLIKGEGDLKSTSSVRCLFNWMQWLLS